MKKLFLTSYLAGTKSLVNKFLGDLSNKEIVFIPTAANVEEYTSYIDEAEIAFKELGYSIKLLDISKVERDKIIDIIDNTECIYISGGNTFYLLQELKRLELIDCLKLRTEKDLYYIGESAGAIITSKNIEYAKDMDDKTKGNELEEYSGLDLVDFYLLPHNNEFPFEDSTRRIIEEKNNELNLLPINNSEAVIVENDKYKIVSENK